MTGPELFHRSVDLGVVTSSAEGLGIWRNLDRFDVSWDTCKDVQDLNVPIGSSHYSNDPIRSYMLSFTPTTARDPGHCR